jgi:hypothetical protein
VENNGKPKAVFPDASKNDPDSYTSVIPYSEEKMTSFLQVASDGISPCLIA